MTPKLSKDELQNILVKHNIWLSEEKLCIVGIRGYYANTFGKRGVNDRGVYDDAIFIVSENDFGAYQANVDPSKYRFNIASLVPGIYTAVKWFHKHRVWGLQIILDTVKRDGVDALDTGRHGIDFHDGGNVTTGSEGCQTMTPIVWPFFIRKLYALMGKYGKTQVRYLLIDNAEIA